MDAVAFQRRNGFQVQERDVEIVAGLFECRIMERRHIAQVYFCGKMEAAKKRLQALCSAQLIKIVNPTRAVTVSAIYSLGKAGFDLLQSEGRLRRYEETCGEQFVRKRCTQNHAVSVLTLAHELAVMDVKAAFCESLRQRPDYRIVEFTTWPRLYEIHIEGDHLPDGCPRLLRPDGFVHLERSVGEKRLSQFFFLEVDRATESQAILIKKIEGYTRHNCSPAFTRFVTGDEGGTPIPFRTLMIFLGPHGQGTEERLFNHAHWLSRFKPPLPRASFWLTTLAALGENLLGNIWICPEDYQGALAGTAFDPCQVDWKPHGRVTGRDALVRSRAIRRTLLPTSEPPT